MNGAKRCKENVWGVVLTLDMVVNKRESTKVNCEFLVGRIITNFCKA